MTLSVQAKNESFFMSSYFKKVYITAKTTKHVINDNEIIEDDKMLIKLVYSFEEEDIAKARDLIGKLIDKNPITFIVETDFTDVKDNKGHTLKQFTVLEFK